MFHTNVRQKLTYVLRQKFIHFLRLANNLAMNPHTINGVNYQKYIATFKGFKHYVHTDVMCPSSNYNIYYIKLNHCEFDIKQLSLFQNDSGKIDNTCHGDYPLSIILFNLNQNLHDIVSLSKKNRTQ